MFPFRVLAIPIMASMLILTACGGNGSASQTRAPVGPPAAAPATNTAGISSTSPTSPAAPGGGPSSSPTTAHPAREGDVDGDGHQDKLSLTGNGVLKVDYSAGGSEMVKFTAFDFAPVKVIGVLDADRDGHAEVFVTFDLGAYIVSTTIFRYFDGHLHLMTRDGEQVRLASGGSTGFLAAWACHPSAAPDAAMATIAGSSRQPNVYDVTLEFFTFAGPRLVPLRSEHLGPTPLAKIPSLSDKTPESAKCSSGTLLADF